MNEKKECYGVCPYCGSPKIDYVDETVSTDDTVHEVWACGNCKKRFVEKFKKEYVETEYEVIDEDLIYLMTRWNNNDEVITSVDIGGDNYTIAYRGIISKDDMDKIALKVLVCKDKTLSYTARELLNLFKQNCFRVYKEVPYI